MIDGQLSFLLVFGLLGAAVVGVALFLACLGMMCLPRHRHRVLRSWKFGAVGGGIALMAMALLLWFAASNGTAIPPSLFAAWFGMAFFAGFWTGVALDVGLRMSGRIPDVGQTPSKPPSQSA